MNRTFNSKATEYGKVKKKMLLICHCWGQSFFNLNKRTARKLHDILLFQIM